MNVERWNKYLRKSCEIPANHGKELQNKIDKLQIGLASKQSAADLESSCHLRVYCPVVDVVACVRCSPTKVLPFDLKFSESLSKGHWQWTSASVIF